MPRPPEVLQVGDVRLVIDLDAGARAVEWWVGECSLLAHYGSKAIEYGMYPMAPWAGRLRGNGAVIGGAWHEFPVNHDPWAIHGTVLDKRVEVIERIDADGRALLVGRVTDHPGWPWPTDVDITWDLRGRELITEITVQPHADEVPAIVGWHPWFRRDIGAGDPLQWHVDAAAQVERGADHLPTGRLVDVGLGPFDDAFWVPGGAAMVRWPGALRLDIVNDADWYVVFDELAAGACVEPQSGPPNAFNEPLGHPVPMASPSAPHRMVTRWTMRDDPPEDRG